jgi:hypothetical protein
MVSHRLADRGRLVRIALVAVAAVVVVAGASAARPAKGTKRAQLVAALRQAQGQVGIQSVTLSTADSGYALVRWGAKGNENDLFRLERGKWTSVWRREFDRPADGACAYAPATVVRDLFRVACPPAKAVKAKVAPGTVSEQLLASLEKSELTPWWRDARFLRPACVSRLNANWAAALARFSGSSAVIWFQHKGEWRPVYESVSGRGKLPPDSVVLSLASCVGYSAPDYGA